MCVFRARSLCHSAWPARCFLQQEKRGRFVLGRWAVAELLGCLTCFVLLQLYGRRAPWEDPARWVMDSYPWAASPQQHEWPPLLQLRPEDVGLDGHCVSREGSAGKQLPVSDAEGDPLVSSSSEQQNSFICLGSGGIPANRSQSLCSESHSPHAFLPFLPCPLAEPVPP